MATRGPGHPGYQPPTSFNPRLRQEEVDEDLVAFGSQMRMAVPPPRQCAVIAGRTSRRPARCTNVGRFRILAESAHTDEDQWLCEQCLPGMLVVLLRRGPVTVVEYSSGPCAPGTPGSRS